MVGTSHVLGLPNANVVVPFRFTSHRLLCAMDRTFNVLRLWNVNVLVPVFCASLSRLRPRHFMDDMDQAQRERRTRAKDTYKEQ